MDRRSSGQTTLVWCVWFNAFIECCLSREVRRRRIDFVFDRNPKLEERIRAIFSQLRLLPDLAEFHHRFGEVRFASRRDTPQLQAADILAYESYKHVVNAFSGFPRSQRKSFAPRKSRIAYSQP